MYRVLVAACLVAATAACGHYSEATDEQSGWSLAPSLSQRRSYAAAAAVGGRIYVAGGMVGETGRHLASFQVFDPRLGRWSGLPALPEPVRAAAAAAVGSVVLVAGGTTPGGGGRQVFSYGVPRGGWKE